MFSPAIRHLGAFLLALCLAALCGCPKKNDGGGAGPSPVNRCEVDLASSGLFSQEGAGASARVIASADELIGGQTASGRLGDVLLQNEKVRVVIEQPGRQVGPVLYGGSIIDADLVRPPGSPGHDQFGRMTLAYALGRVSKVTHLEVLSDGSAGGPAVVAATGEDVEHDLFSLKTLVKTQTSLNLAFVIDPTQPVPVRVTTYLVLSPGESRVRMLTAFCNDGEGAASFPLVELFDFRGSVEVFNPGGCANGLGTAGCLVDSSRWVGAQGDGVAYGIRSHSLADLKVPVQANATVIYGGVVGSVIEGKDLAGITSWTDPEARTRPGTFLLRPGAQRSYLRDFVIAQDLAAVSAQMNGFAGVATSRLEVSAKNADGSAAPFARVAVVTAAGDQLETVIATDAQGRGSAGLAPGSYLLSAAREGTLPGATVALTVQAGETRPVAVSLAESRTLTVRMADPAGLPIPGKVTVRCKGGSCPFSAASWKRHVLLENTPEGTAAISFGAVSGRVEVPLPPGEYEVVVSRGPEWSVWPDRWPAGGEAVDLRQASQEVSAVLGRVLDTSGWISADLHVHAINSSDSPLPNEDRVANFLSEGVDLLISTDHDYVTDFAPVVRAMGAEALMATMIGEEVTSFTHGHFNTFPVVRDPASPNGGAFDHAGGEGPTLRLPQLFFGIKEASPGAVVQINHPRGNGGALTQLRVDTATLASHGVAEDFMMAPSPEATASDTKLFSDTFDALEVANGPEPQFAVVNDWMTFLSRGTVRTATGVSDTHRALSKGGYARSWVRVGTDTTASFSAASFAEGVRRQRLVLGNGVFLQVKARKLDGAGAPVGEAVEVGDTLSVSAAAGESVELVVDITAPEWVQFDRIELYSHAAGREAVNGESNSTWPEGRILAKKELDPLALTVEPVPGATGVPLRRVHVSEKFVQKPAADTWYAVMVRSVNSTRNLSPLVEARPFALSNAILVDADGSGAYDTYPLKAGLPLKFQQPAKPPRPPKVPNPEELEHALRELLGHCHP